MAKEKFQIGWFTLKEDKEYTRNYEFAAWYQVIKVPKGQYPVYANEFAYHERERRYLDKIKDTAIFYPLHGEVVASDFSAHFAGNRVGNKVNEDVGEQSYVVCQPYAHALAKGILEGDVDIELLPEFEAREIPYVYDGKEQKTYGIFKV